MARYLIFFNQQWVGDHPEEWYDSRGPLARAVVAEMAAAGVLVAAGGLEQNPNKNFIGIDIKGARFWRGAKTALEDNLGNEKFSLESASIYPNPSNGNVYVNFNGIDGETASINVMDINGRVVKNENLGKLNSGQIGYVFETTDLSSGIYIVAISSDSGIKRVAKLVVTK